MGKLHVWMPLVLTGTGSEVWTRRLAYLLRERGHTVTLDEIPHHFQYAPWLAPVRCPGTANVTIANSWNAAAFQKGAPVVSVTHLVVHDPALAQFKTLPQSVFHRFFVYPMERMALRSIANVAVSQKVGKQMRDTFAYRDAIVVRNGVDTEYFHPIERPKEGPLRLLFVGKPSKRKGFDLVTEIIHRLGNKVTFTCVGEKPEDGPNGTYTGPLDREGVREAYQDADLLLFPSRMEGYGLVAAEALACGVPVVASRGTAVDEIVPESCCILANDTDTFVGRISSLRRQDITAMRGVCRDHAVAHLGEVAWVEGMEAVLHRIAR